MKLSWYSVSIWGPHHEKHKMGENFNDGKMTPPPTTKNEPWNRGPQKCSDLIYRVSSRTTHVFHIFFNSARRIANKIVKIWHWKIFEGKGPSLRFRGSFFAAQKITLRIAGPTLFLCDPPWLTPTVPAQYPLSKRFSSGFSPMTCPVRLEQNGANRHVGCAYPPQVQYNAT